MNYVAIVADESITIPANTTKVIYAEVATTPDTYHVSVTSSDGSVLDGSIAVRVSQEELGIK